MRIPGIMTDLAKQLLDAFDYKLQQALMHPVPKPTGQPIIVAPAPVIVPVPHGYVSPGELAWMVNARHEIGVTEIPGPENNPRILWYHSFTTLHASYDSVSWCSAFANAMLITAGIPGTRSAAALDWENMHWGLELKYAVHGCLSIWNWGNGHGHVAMVDEANDDGLFVIGGNQRDQGEDKVCRKFFPWSLAPESFKWPKEIPLPAGAELEK